MLIGYHYTTYDNWLDIQKNGLQPKAILKTEYNYLDPLFKYFKKRIKGIWIWTEEPKVKDHLGVLLFLAAIKNATRIVKLEIQYDENHRLNHRGRVVEIIHDTSFQNFKYNKDVMSYILTQSIPIKDIKLIADYNLLTLLK